MQYQTGDNKKKQLTIPAAEVSQAGKINSRGADDTGERTVGSAW